MSKQRLKLDRQQQERFSRIRRLEQLKGMDPIAFEHFVGYLYQQQGYRVSTTVTSGDEGVDLFLQKGTKTAVVQCKRYSGTVGQPTVRDLYGAMYHNQANEAILVTTGTISRPAEEWARGKPIRLVDGHELMSWTRQNRRQNPPVVSRASAPSRPINWRIISILGIVVLCLALIGWAGWLAWQTLSDRTASPLPLPPTPIAVEETPNPTAAAPRPTFTPEVEIAPTVTLPATTSTNVNAIRFDQPIILDGDLLEWGNVQGVTTPYITEREDTWDGSMDVEANWRVAWDNENLYFGITIVDDVHVQTQEAKFAYRGDSLELQLDTNVPQDYGPTMNQDDFQYVFSPGNFIDIPPGVFRFQGDDQGFPSDALGSRARVMAVQTTNGYQLEAIIPWQDMNVFPQPNLKIGAALSTNDNDTPGVAKQELMVSNVSTRLWRDPTSWGTITLQE